MVFIVNQCFFSVRLGEIEKKISVIAKAKSCKGSNKLQERRPRVCIKYVGKKKQQINYQQFVCTKFYESNEFLLCEVFTELRGECVDASIFSSLCFPEVNSSLPASRSTS